MAQTTPPLWRRTTRPRSQRKRPRAPAHRQRTVTTPKRQPQRRPSPWGARPQAKRNQAQAQPSAPSKAPNPRLSHGKSAGKRNKPSQRQQKRNRSQGPASDPRQFWQRAGTQRPPWRQLRRDPRQGERHVWQRTSSLTPQVAPKNHRTLTPLDNERVLTTRLLEPAPFMHRVAAPTRPRLPLCAATPHSSQAQNLHNGS